MGGSEFVSFLEEKRVPFVGGTFVFLQISILFVLVRALINDSLVWIWTCCLGFEAFSVPYVLPTNLPNHLFLLLLILPRRAGWATAGPCESRGPHKMLSVSVSRSRWLCVHVCVHIQAHTHTRICGATSPLRHHS